MSETKIYQHATLIKKEDTEYFPIPGDLPFPSELYDVQFETDTGEILDCTCSMFEFHVLEEGDSGELEIRDHEIVRFANKIKEIE